MNTSEYLINILSHPIMIGLFLFIIVCGILYKTSGQEHQDKIKEYKIKKQELKTEREKLNQERYDLEQEKEIFENKKESIIYVKNNDSLLLGVLLIISVIINIYLLDKLQEYYQLFGELKEMSEILKMLL